MKERTSDLMIGVTEKAAPTTEEEWHAEEIVRNGYTIIENVLTTDELQYLQSGTLEKYYKIQVNEVGGEDKLFTIGDEYSVKHLLVYEDFFVNLIIKQKIISQIKLILGESFIINLQNAIINFPKVDNPASIWHRDLPYQHFICSKPLSITCLYVVDGFNEETGGTIVLPASHQHGEFPSTQFALKYKQQLTAKAGSVLMMDSMMYHQAGYNRSNQVRRAIAQIYTLPLIKQQISYPRLLKGKYADNPVLNKLLGYDSEPPENVLKYREERLYIKGGYKRTKVGGGRMRKMDEN